MEELLNIIKETVNSWTPETITSFDKEELKKKFSSLGINSWAAKDIPNYLNNIAILLSLELHNKNKS